ncbi:MAG: HAD hydrolase family protein, partial [Enterococcus cecorum]|nr:HAD hydrolase family protein [Enterococcus cecorum]
AQKGIAVKKIAEMLNIPLSQAMTIGDNFNDLSMIQEAGVSFAMENAVDELKQAAKYIADTNINSGVGKAIRRAIDENLS